MADPFDHEADDTKTASGDGASTDLGDNDFQEQYDGVDGDQPSTHQASSHFQHIMDSAVLYGVSPGPDDPDTREIYVPEDAAEAATSIIDTLARDIAPDGSPIADDRAELLWGMVHVFDSQARNLQNQIDRDLREHDELRHAEGISETNDLALQKALDRIVDYNDRAKAFDTLRRVAASSYRRHTNEVWRSRRRTDTAADSPRIHMQDYARSRNWRAQHDGIRIAVTGGRDTPSEDTVREVLDDLLRRHGSDLVIVHGGRSVGLDAITAAWCKESEVRQAVYRPNFKTASHQGDALARRNRLMLKDGLSAVVSFSSAGLARSSNLLILAQKQGIPVDIINPALLTAAGNRASLAGYRRNPTETSTDHAAAAHPDGTSSQRQQEQSDRSDREPAGLRDVARIVTPAPDARRRSVNPDIGALYRIVDGIRDDITPEGYQLADQRESLLWGFVNVFDQQVKRLDRAIDAANRNAEADANQIAAAVANLEERKYTFEELQVAAASLYFKETSKHWDLRIRDRAPTITSTKLDFDAFVQDRERERHAAQAPHGRVVIVHGDRIDGSLQTYHYDQLADQLDAIRAKHGAIIIAHGAYKQGVDKLAAMWAENRGVPQILCPPRYHLYKNSQNPAARAAFERNRAMFDNLQPRELVLFGDAERGTAANMLELAKSANQFQHGDDPGVDITTCRFDPMLPARNAINQQYLELLERAEQNPRLIPYQKQFTDFQTTVSAAIKAQQHPPEYTERLTALNDRLTTENERMEKVQGVQRDVLDLANQLSYMTQAYGSENAGFMETPPLYDTFVADCTSCLTAWNALRADPDMELHMERLALPEIDASVEVLSEHARYENQASVESAQANQLAEEPAQAPTRHPIVAEYIRFITQADNKAELLAYQPGIDHFRDTGPGRDRIGQRTSRNCTRRFSAWPRPSTTAPPNVPPCRTSDSSSSTSSKQALSLEEWAAVQNAKVTDAPEYEKWRETADSLIATYRTISSRPEYRPHLDHRPEIADQLRRRVEHLTETHFDRPAKVDPTQQQVLQAQQTQEAQREQGYSMTA